MGKDQCGVEANAVYPTNVQAFNPANIKPHWNNQTKACPKPKFPAPTLPKTFYVIATDKSDNSTGTIAVSEGQHALFNSGYMTAGDKKLWLCDPDGDQTTYDITDDGFNPATCQVNPDGQTCPWDPDQDVIMMGLKEMVRRRTNVPCGMEELCSIYTYDGDDSQEMWLTADSNIPVKEVQDGTTSIEYSNFISGESDMPADVFTVPTTCLNSTNIATA